MSAPWHRIRRLRLALTFFAGVGLAGLVWASRGHDTRRDEPIPDALRARLVQLGERAIESRDVPVAAVLLRDGEIVGEGFNTVRRDGHAGGHAEINAISNAIETLGHEAFFATDPSTLSLVTTFEPCPMCRGALVLYRIEDVTYLTDKGWRTWFDEELRDARLQWGLQQRPPEDLQYKLFERHPAWRERADAP